MSLDPRRYDLDELRAASDAPDADGTDGGARTIESTPGWDATHATTGTDRDSGVVSTTPDTGERADGRNRPAAAAFETAVVRDLAVRDATDGADERPYLSALPGSFVAEALLFEWLEFLVLRAGHDSATAALTYYERIGWLGAEAAAALDTYLSGLNEAGVDGDGELDADDHRMSLHYVARLAALRG